MEEVKFNNLLLEEKELLQAASDAGNNYLNKKSTRRVGAAILGENGKTYVGASIRRTNVSSSTCAERMAIDQAVFQKCYDYRLLAVVGFFLDNIDKEITPPCGMCRQILSETETYGETRQAIPVILANHDFSIIIRTDSQELFPLAYKGRSYK